MSLKMSIEPLAVLPLGSWELEATPSVVLLLRVHHLEHVSTQNHITPFARYITQYALLLY